MVHLVAYDLKTPNDTEENYEKIFDGIKQNFPTWCHVEQSVWLVDSPSDAGTVRDILKSYLHTGDLLFVARLAGNWASSHLGDQRNRWLKGRTF